MKSRLPRARRALKTLLSMLANGAVSVRCSVGTLFILLDIPDGDSWCLKPSDMCYCKPLYRVPFRRFVKSTRLFL